MTTPKIRIRGLKKAFGAKRVLDGVDLDVMPGTAMVVIGGSGTGKSVLIKSILGLITPDAGVIEIDGVDVLTAPRSRARELRGQIGMLFQNGALFDSMTVWENVAFGLLAERKIKRGQARARGGAGGGGGGGGARRAGRAAGAGWIASNASAAPQSRSPTTWRARSASATKRQCCSTAKSSGPARRAGCSRAIIRTSISSRTAKAQGRSGWRCANKLRASGGWGRRPQTP